MREQAGLSPAELSRRLGVHQSTVSRAERSETRPSLDLMESWAHACGREFAIDFPLPGERVGAYTEPLRMVLVALARDMTEEELEAVRDFVLALRLSRDPAPGWHETLMSLVRLVRVDRQYTAVAEAAPSRVPLPPELDALYDLEERLPRQLRGSFSAERDVLVIEWDDGRVGQRATVLERARVLAERYEALLKQA